MIFLLWLGLFQEGEKSFWHGCCRKLRARTNVEGEPTSSSFSVVLRHHSLRLLSLHVVVVVVAFLSGHSALSKELMRSVGEGASVAPRASTTFEVHAHLRLALLVINADATRACGGTTSALTEITTAAVGYLADVGGEVPVRGLGIVVDVVHLPLGSVRDLPTGWQLRTLSGVLRIVAHV